MTSPTHSSDPEHGAAWTVQHAAGVLATASLGAAMAGWVLSLFLAIDELSTCTYELAGGALGWQPSLLAVLVPAAFLFGLAAHRLARRDPAMSATGAAVALAPALGLVPCGLVQPGFPVLCLGLLLFGAATMRLLRHWDAALPRPWPAAPGWLAPAAVAVATAALVVYAALLQMRALHAGRLSYSDWGLYLEVALNTLRGNWFFSNDIGRNYLGHHFLPGAVALLLPFAALRSLWAVFALNGLALYGGGFLLYLLARDRGLGRMVAACLAGCYLAHPALSNMTYAMGYGFHSIHLVMPLIPAYFLLDGRGHRRWALAVFLFSLTINETVGIFWAGAALGLALTERQDRRRHAAMGVVALAYSLVVMKWVIPAISGLPGYEFISRYAHLGDSYLSILWSPIQRPQAFFGTLFRQENLLYLALLVIPAVWLALARPVLLLAGGLIMVGVCLQDSAQTVILPLQYHSEFVAWLGVMAVFGAERMLRPASAPICLRLAGYPARAGGPALARAAILASLATALLCFSLLSLAPWSRNSQRGLIQASPLTPQLAPFEQLIPAGTELSATPFLASRYLFRNEIFYPSAKLCDQVFLDLGERSLFGTSYESQRRALLASPDYACVRAGPCGNGRFLMLFRKLAPGEARPPPLTPRPEVVGDEAWARLGVVPATWDEPGISCRLRVAVTSPERITLTVTLRLERQFDHDVDLQVTVMDRQAGAMTMLLPFGNGVWPAYLLAPKSAWTFTLSNLPKEAPLHMKMDHKPPP